MNQQRLWIVLMLVGAVVMGISFYVYRDHATAADANNPTASPAAAGATAAPSAAVQTTTSPTTTTAANSAAVAPRAVSPLASSSSAPAPAPAAGTTKPRAVFASDQRTPLWLSLGSLNPEANFPFRLQLTSEGAAVGTLKLAGYYATVADKKLAARYGHDFAHYEQEVAAHPESYGGNYSLLNPLQGEGEQYLPLATRRIDVWLPDSNEPLSWKLDNKQWQVLDGPTTDANGSETIRFAFQILHDPNWADAEGPRKREPLLKVVKTYTIRKNDYSLDVTLEAVNESNLPLKVALSQSGATGVPADDSGPDMRQVVIGKIKDAEPYVIFKPRTHLPTMTLGKFEPVGYSQEDGRRMLWLGETNKFFGAILYPHPVSSPESKADSNVLGWPGRNLQFAVAAAQENPASRTYVTGVTIGMIERGGTGDGVPNSPVEVSPKGTLRVGFDLFAGPKKREMFSDESAAGFRPLYKELDYLGTIEFGSCCSWAPLTLGMMWLLQFLSKIALGNYGVAIILLVILVRLVMHPLTKKGQVMMSKMQKMGPAVEQLKKKFGDDKEQLQKEMMKVYKQQGFTPLLGCLPMMLQIPIWAALFGALNAAVELRQAPFLPVWLTDLSAPDAIFSFSFSLPVIGHTLNLLPVLGCVSMFVQMKYTPQGAPPTTPEQKQQQAMMKWMMPIMMMFMFYNWPTGLNLYYMVSGFFAAGEQYVIRKHIKEREELQASTVTMVSAGKSPRGNRTKKPKGPYWFKRG